LEGTTTDAQAAAKFQEWLTRRRKGALPVLERTPKFADEADQYFEFWGFSRLAAAAAAKIPRRGTPRILKTRSNGPVDMPGTAFYTSVFPSRQSRMVFDKDSTLYGFWR
jgi:hypothetical protein